MKFIEEKDCYMLQNEIIQLSEESDKIYFASGVVFDNNDWKKMRRDLSESINDEVDNYREELFAKIQADSEVVVILSSPKGQVGE